MTTRIIYCLFVEFVLVTFPIPYCSLVVPGVRSIKYLNPSSKNPPRKGITIQCSLFSTIQETARTAGYSITYTLQVARLPAIGGPADNAVHGNYQANEGDFDFLTIWFTNTSILTSASGLG